MSFRPLSSRGHIIWISVLVLLLAIGVAIWNWTTPQSAPTDVELATTPIVVTVRGFVDDVLAGRFDAASARTTRTSALTTLLPGDSEPFRSNGNVVAGKYLPIYNWQGIGGTAWRVDARLEMSNGKVLLAKFNVVEAPPGTFLIHLWDTDPWPDTGFELGDASQPSGTPEVNWMPGTRKIDPKRK